MRNDLTQDDVVSRFDYCKTTGIFRSKRSGRQVGTVKKGSRSGRTYVRIKIRGVAYGAHRPAWLYVTGQMPELGIDHHIGLPKNSTSGVRGVSFQKNEKHWTAYIYHNRKRIHLGCFKEMQPAVEARIAAEAALFTHSSIKKGGQHGTE